jgi:GxxExxY protein
MKRFVSTLKKTQAARRVLFVKMDNVIPQVSQMVSEVWSFLGPGFNEATYHKALEKEMQLNGVQFDSEVTIPFVYKGRSIGFGRGDILVHPPMQSGVLIELKATQGVVGDTEFMQLQRYLKFLDLNDGMLVHFGQKRGSTISVFHTDGDIVKKIL